MSSLDVDYAILLDDEYDDDQYDDRISHGKSCKKNNSTAPQRPQHSASPFWMAIFGVTFGFQVGYIVHYAFYWMSMIALDLLWQCENHPHDDYDSSSMSTTHSGLDAAEWSYVCIWSVGESLLALKLIAMPVHEIVDQHDNDKETGKAETASFPCFIYGSFFGVLTGVVVAWSAEKTPLGVGLFLGCALHAMYKSLCRGDDDDDDEHENSNQEPLLFVQFVKSLLAGFVIHSSALLFNTVIFNIWGAQIVAVALTSPHAMTLFKWVYAPIVSLVETAVVVKFVPGLNVSSLDNDDDCKTENFLSTQCVHCMGVINGFGLAWTIKQTFLGWTGFAACGLWMTLWLVYQTVFAASPVQQQKQYSGSNRMPPKIACDTRVTSEILVI